MLQDIELRLRNEGYNILVLALQHQIPKDSMPTKPHNLYDQRRFHFLEGR